MTDMSRLRDIQNPAYRPTVSLFFCKLNTQQFRPQHLCICIVGGIDFLHLTFYVSHALLSHPPLRIHYVLADVG